LAYLKIQGQRVLRHLRCGFTGGVISGDGDNLGKLKGFLC